MRCYNESMDRDDFFDERDDERESEREVGHALQHPDARPGIDREVEVEIVEPEYELPKSLEERARRDIELLSRIDGLVPEMWRERSPQQRLETFREAERQLAALHGREPYRTYAVTLPRFIDGECGHMDSKPVYLGSRYAWTDYVEGRYIRLSETLLYSFDPHKPVQVFAHESFHAYQYAVMCAHKPDDAVGAARRFPEVDELTVGMWREWMHQPSVKENILEQHAELYAIMVVERLYPGFWASTW